MDYIILLWPHANARYMAETRRLAQAETELMLRDICPGATVAVDESGGMPALALWMPEPLNPLALERLRGMSLLYGLFERRSDGSLMPLTGRASAHFGDDLPAILKYKGKTNELFLQLLINVALYSGNYINATEPLEFLDPMCGRATAPFIALNRGWNAVGADVDKTDLKEAETFFKRYLEYHRFKHHITRASRTLRGKPPVPVVRFEAADTPEHFKEGETLRLDLAAVDAALAGEAFPRNTFHIIACDLPYGVKHAAQAGSDAPKGKDWLEALLVRALKGWHAILRPGGTVALSFNAQTMRRDKLRGLMEDAGFEALCGGPYDAFEHWVEQAITRDIAVARKKS